MLNSNGQCGPYPMTGIRSATAPGFSHPRPPWSRSYSALKVASHFRWKIGDERGFLVGMLGDGCNGLVELAGRVFGGGRVEQLAAELL